MGCRMTPGIAGAWLCIPHGGMAESPGPIRAAVRTRDNIYKETDIDRLVPPMLLPAQEDPRDISWLRTDAALPPARHYRRFPRRPPPHPGDAGSWRSP
jgi:hypothetical protein